MKPDGGVTADRAVKRGGGVTADRAVKRGGGRSAGDPAGTVLFDADRVHYPVFALEPGTRVGLWVRGCTLGCPGCMSRELAPARLESAVPVGEVVARLAPFLPRATGLTVTGGEPFQQAAALGAFLGAVRRLTDGRAPG